MSQIEYRVIQVIQKRFNYTVSNTLDTFEEAFLADAWDIEQLEYDLVAEFGLNIDNVIIDAWDTIDTVILMIEDLIKEKP